MTPPRLNVVKDALSRVKEAEQAIIDASEA